ncbi:ion transporter [Micromonospora sp. PPF5-17]|uniref:Ion transporter n=1 Tax=Micromonospora solifontis TaxID=2487138 RepID=A0ABX9WK12_9ACTN|nr:ion transporter [Micromonospora sp. PPF5-17B]NES35570.1 ion transporter [Micromonospora solifontis]NES55944.1 ion transporter [Micromonospora sp. PPF5-6]RNM00624.1 ion transporter [Micromonospora solifontis]
MSVRPAPRQRGVAPPSPSRVSAWCARLEQSRGFEVAIVIVVGLNAVVLGIETYPHPGSLGTLLRTLEWFFRAVFVSEIAIRVLAHGNRPQDFFRHGWNVFDFVVIAAAFIPGLHGESPALRVIRIARVVRLVRFSPGLRTIVAALLRSLPGVGGFLALALVTLYVYGMAGWLIFGDSDPERYGTIGRAALTLFVLLSLENLPELIEHGMALSPWTLVYYVSFVLITANLLVNILIAVIVNSMEEARRLEMTEGMAADEDGDGVPDDLDRIIISQRLDDLRALVAELERDLRVDRGTPGGRGGLLRSGDEPGPPSSGR